MSRDILCDAIGKRCQIAISYSGSQRVVEPHLLGYSSKGALMLSAWQVSGGSGQGWRDFFVDKIASVALTQTNFDARPGYNPNDPAMTQIICRL
jgi:predicted DNA-binding transcriptional regulator YafY